MTIDVRSGTLFISASAKLVGAMNAMEVRDQNIKFVRSLRLSPRSEMLSTEDMLFAGHKTYFSITLLDDLVLSVSFGFADYRGMEPAKQQELYREFLIGQLGLPPIDKAQDHLASYKYWWGDITAMFDGRAGTADITMSWKNLHPEYKSA